ncbi:hypothetical protein LAG90_02145 [Marinilongibacter aquaticus]|uniref:hypothetical protein n=1 Tax=Marinilongibacter aquaticus TaxID=2975157 RepID=UPI0021BD38B5|nr:hypothetical protein [Marinilongibacter aquaticus]UBM59458.1 hypothetical protein LAG90_02145 [Marinilongibacter aquaticus]
MKYKRWAYLYLPSIAIVLSLAAIGLEIYAKQPIPKSAIGLIIVMSVLLLIGIKNKVWLS